MSIDRDHHQAGRLSVTSSSVTGSSREAAHTPRRPSLRQRQRTQPLTIVGSAVKYRPRSFTLSLDRSTPRSRSYQARSLVTSDQFTPQSQIGSHSVRGIRFSSDGSRRRRLAENVARPGQQNGCEVRKLRRRSIWSKLPHYALEGPETGETEREHCLQYAPVHHTASSVIPTIYDER